MEMDNFLPYTDKNEFYQWLKEHGRKEKECWLILKRGKPKDESTFYYLDAIEVALCFGWIDSTTRSIDGHYYQRFSPRQKNSPWTELNKERVRRLEKLGLMDESGRKVLPKMSFHPNQEIIRELKKARVYHKFLTFPALYQRIRLYNLCFYKNKGDMATYHKMLDHLISYTREGKMFGEWNDYGRLLDY